MPDLMRKYTYIILLCLCPFAARARGITETFTDTPVVSALADIGRYAGKYRLQFIVSEMDGLSVSRNIMADNALEAVKQLCDGLPLRVTLDGRNIFVERMPDKATCISGRLVDSQGKPVDYAAVGLLSRADSTVRTGVLSDEDGAFVLEPDSADPYMRVSQPWASRPVTLIFLTERPTLGR
ncbi:MAG: carboxypeptidase-like regulatory domain-containing protein [Prevotellaceae bacterium]|nr:carboxypeptidase-like regulatory domain-containing protein [Prevotellaceae bacterium]